MNLKEMEATALEERKVAISKECETEGADLDALLEEVRAINEELESRKAEEAKKEELRNLVATENVGEEVEEVEFKENRNNEVEPMEIRNSKEYIDAFAEYIKNGDASECRALLTENVAGGTVAVPDFVADIVKTAWDNDDIMRLVGKTDYRGNYKIGFEISGDDAVIHTEGAAAISPENLLLGVVELKPEMIKKAIQVSDEVNAMRGEAFLRYLYSELAHKIAQKMADTLVAKINACGTVSTTTCPGVAKITASSATVGLIAQAEAFLSDQARNPVVIVSKAGKAEFKAAAYAASYPADPFEGYPVLTNSTLKSFAAASTGDTIAIIGDLGYGAHAHFPDGEGIDFVFDNLTLKKQDLIEILGREYVGLGVVAPGAFVRIVK